nr:hypothetical protein [Acinetobacter bereziniae]
MSGPNKDSIVETNIENVSPTFYKEWSFWFVVIYLLFIVIYTALFIRSDGKNFMLSSNELGDFLAGSFAPLAFLFLYLGYKQQGIELKQNTKALIMQAEELKISNATLKQQVYEMQKSVEAQQNMFLLAEKQFESVLQEKEYQSLPRLSLSGTNLIKNIEYSNIKNSFYLVFINLNIPIKFIKITSQVWSMTINSTLEVRQILNIDEMKPTDVTKIKFYTLSYQKIPYLKMRLLKLNLVI